MKEFRGKVAVITGAASGIGRGLAERCAQEGMKIVLADVEENVLIETESELTAKDVQTMAVVADVSEMDDVEDLARKTMDRFGKVDLLFNNAGVAAGAALWECSINDCKWVIDVNLWGIIHCIRKFVPIMLKQDTPCHIVNTASITGLATYHPSALYHLTKHGIVALSEQLHHDLKIRSAKINVSVLCPGFVDTNIMDAERNRPEAYLNDPSEMRPQPGSEPMYEAIRQMIKNGMSAAEVADAVFQAIAEDRFFIFTHPEMSDLIRTRMDDIIHARNPTLPPMEGASESYGD